MKRTSAMKWVGCVIGAMLLSVSASGQYKQPVPEGFVRLDADEIKTGAIWGESTQNSYEFYDGLVDRPKAMKDFDRVICQEIPEAQGEHRKGPDRI